MNSRSRFATAGLVLMLGAMPLLQARQAKPSDPALIQQRARAYAASYFGGSGTEFCEAVAVDGAGHVFVAGYTTSPDFPAAAKPPLSGKTRKFDRTGMKSPFSQRGQAALALARLIPLIRAPHVFLSYSSEGILDAEQIVAILSTRGKVESMEIPYPVFGNGAGVSVRRTVTEYLFHLTVQG